MQKNPFELINERFDRIESLLAQKNYKEDSSPAVDKDKFLTVAQAAEFLNLATQTVYGLIHRKQIPCFKRQKRVYFSKPDLIAWLESGRLKTHEEIASECRPILVRRGVKA